MQGHEDDSMDADRDDPCSRRRTLASQYLEDFIQPLNSHYGVDRSVLSAPEP